MHRKKALKRLCVVLHYDSYCIVVDRLTSLRVRRVDPDAVDTSVPHAVAVPGPVGAAVHGLDDTG